MDVTKKGGHPVYLIQNREVKDQKISLNDGSNRALAFLKKNGYETDDLEIDESAQYDKIGVFHMSLLKIKSGCIRKRFV